MSVSVLIRKSWKSSIHESVTKETNIWNAARIAFSKYGAGSELFFTTDPETHEKIVRMRFLPDSDPGLCTSNEGRFLKFY